VYNMNIVEIWTNPAKTDLKILVKDNEDEFMAFYGETEGFYIVQLTGDKPMEQLMNVKNFIKEFIDTIYSTSLVVNDQKT
jgi:hypothetical protein